MRRGPASQIPLRGRGLPARAPPKLTVSLRVTLQVPYFLELPNILDGTKPDLAGAAPRRNRRPAMEPQSSIRPRARFCFARWRNRRPAIMHVAPSIRPRARAICARESPLAPARGPPLAHATSHDVRSPLPPPTGADLGCVGDPEAWSTATGALQIDLTFLRGFRLASLVTVAVLAALLRSSREADASQPEAVQKS